MTITINGTSGITLPSGSTAVGTSDSQSLTNKTIGSGYAGSVLTSGTAVASTSGTSITFSSIPSWVKRITFIFNEFSTNGGSHYLVQIGSGSVTSSGYVSTGSSCNQASATGGTSSTAGFVVRNGVGASGLTSGILTIANVSGNTWISSHTYKSSTTEVGFGGGSSPALSGSLDRVVLTTVNGTDTFDAGSVNIMYEG